MGYRKIVQYGDTTEIYDYENNLKKKQGIDHVKAQRLLFNERIDDEKQHLSLNAKRQRAIRLQSKSKGTYERSQASINRSRRNFFRLCHHNNCNAQTIHFVTLTFAYDLSYKKALAHLKRFMERVQNFKSEISLSYISVPELTEEGRYHFHLLVYDLPPETAKLERKTRNFQRLFQRGYVDISVATHNSMGIAGYMAKYMAKALAHEKNEATRGYTCSRNIAKITSAGGNTLSHYSDMIIPTEDIVDTEERSYDVPYLGLCRFTKIISKNTYG